jgi:hypothetical protein
MVKKKFRGHTRAPGDESAGYKRIPVDDLFFDRQNPRLVEYLEGQEPSQEELLRVLWQQMAVDELAMSIAASGYFDYEPLFVTEENGELVVIDGNRRLAAVKLLLDMQKRVKLLATDLPEISAAAAARLQELPVIRTTRKDAWQYQGFKHVNGPGKWDSYAKAHYIAQVRNGLGVPLAEIARQIGDRHGTVQRLYRALMVIEQAEQAKVFNRANRYTKLFSFSHLYTGLDYEGIASFVNLRDESSESSSPVPKNRMKELGELCSWLYGDRSLDKPPKVESQNPHLRQLDEVLRSPQATDALRAGLPLGAALEVSYGDERVFQSALIQAKEALQKAHSKLTTGYHGEDELLRLGNTICNLAYDLVDEMERKKTPRRRKRISEGADG